jgi:hypothetical protein
MALARHARNVSDCKGGTDLCDYAALTPSETSEVTAAKDKRNAQNCENGWDECDHSKLTPLEAVKPPLQSTSATSSLVGGDQET